MNDIFVIPDVELLNLNTSINAEVGPPYNQFTYEIECPCIDTVYTNILLCFGDSIVIDNNIYTAEGYLDTLTDANDAIVF